MVDCEMMVRSVLVCWRHEFSAAATIYAGQQINTAGLPAWVELWVDAWDDAVRRNGSPDQQWVWVSVHCFSREPLEATRVQRLAAAARVVLARRLIDVRDYSTSDEPIVARIRMRESDARELTREEGEETRGVLRHIVVTCRGRVEEFTG